MNAITATFLKTHRYNQPAIRSKNVRGVIHVQEVSEIKREEEDKL